MLTLESAYDQIQRDSLFAFLYHEGEIAPVYNMQVPWRADKVALLPGSFNPLHAAHEDLFANMRVLHAREKGNPFCCFELSMERIDKEFLTGEDLQERLEQFNGVGPVLVDRWPYFIQKAGVLRLWNPTFHIGIDTAIRLVETHGIAGIQGIHANFVVYDRVLEGYRQGLATCSVFANRCPINFEPGDTRREALLGLSSTAIRSGRMTRDGKVIDPLASN